MKKVFFLENLPSDTLMDPKSSYYLNDMRARGTRLRFDAPNKKIFRDLRTLTV